MDHPTWTDNQNPSNYRKKSGAVEGGVSSLPCQGSSLPRLAYSQRCTSQSSALLEGQQNDTIIKTNELKASKRN